MAPGNKTQRIGHIVEGHVQGEGEATLGGVAHHQLQLVAAWYRNHCNVTARSRLRKTVVPLLFATTPKVSLVGLHERSGLLSVGSFDFKDLVPDTRDLAVHIRMRMLNMGDA